MGQPVEQGAGETLGAEDFGLFVERQVAGDQGGAAFIALPSIPENLSEIYRAKVVELVRTLSEPEVVHRASEMLAEIITRIEVRWDQTAKAHHL